MGTIEPSSDAVTEESLVALRARCRAELAAILERGLPGASLALVLPDGRLVTEVAGLADVDTGEVLTADHRLLSGSAGKTYVVGVLLHLLEQGRLDLDAPLPAAFPERSATWWERLPGVHQVTLRQLLRHQSGLPRYVFQPGFGEALAADPSRAWTPAECLAWIHDQQALFAPGEGFAYADSNYLLVGLALEAASGRSFRDLARELLLEPHGLEDTLATDRVDLPGVAQGHVVSGRALAGGERTRRDGRFTYNVLFEWCGGGWASTPADLARWAATLYGGRAADWDYLPEVLATVPAEELGPGLAYGLAAMVRPTAVGPLVGHDGYMPGYLTAMGWLPEQRLALALQVNGDDVRSLEVGLGARLATLAEELVPLLPVGG